MPYGSKPNSNHTRSSPLNPQSYYYYLAISNSAEVTGPNRPKLHIRHTTESEEARNHVWARMVKRSIPGPDGCLDYITAAGGYGIVYVPRVLQEEGWPRQVNASRFACYIHHGPPTNPTAQARHLCHRPPCIAPEHLRWGSFAQNVMDSVASGRRGNKLTPFQVGEIMNLLAQGHRPSYIANLYGVTAATITHIKNGRSWAWYTSAHRDRSFVPDGSIAARLRTLAPDCPDGTDIDAHVNQWVMDEAMRRHVNTSEATRILLGWQRPPMRVKRDQLDAGLVLEVAADLKIDTSDAADLMCSLDP